MNLGLKIFLLHWILIGCASTPKAPVKKKAGTTTAAGKSVKAPAGKAPMKKAPTPPVAEPVEEEEEEEEEDDQFSRIKKYYKK
jgi:hypothetical protein